MIKRSYVKGLLMLAVLLFVISGFGGCGGSGGSNPQPESPEVSSPVATQTITIHDEKFELELAMDDAERQQGLSDREEIAADGGMMFVFAYPRQTQFVMRRCYVPIDLIYVDDAGYIDSLHAMEVIQPVGGKAWLNPSTGYSSAGHILIAIELKGGTIARLGLKRGEKLDLPIKELQSKAG